MTAEKSTQKIYQLPVEITQWKFDGVDRAGPDLLLSLVPR